MAYLSQNNEVEVIINYFQGKTGALLSLGENDGKTFSNSYDLIKLGWYAVLVEPANTAYEALHELYKDNDKVSTFEFAIGTKTEKITFYQPGDTTIATTKKELLDVWEHAKDYKEVLVDCYSWAGVKLMYPVFGEKFEFVSIDCEGLDLEILLQLDLEEMGCECLCIEFSSKYHILEQIKTYCAKFGLTKELLRNGENVILAK